MRELFSSKLKLSLAALLLGVGTFFAINQAMSSTQAASRDCSSNAVITCGVMSISELRAKYNNDTTPGTKNIFSGMGITSSMVNNYKVQDGIVHGNGNVTIGGKVVATGAHSAGREKRVGGVERTYNGTRYYDRAVGLWNTPSWTAFVFTDSKGNFVGAVMKICGNPVKANPVKPPEPPKPVYRCVSLSRIKQDNPAKYIFRGKSATENGAKATGFTFEFGDGKSQNVAVQRTEGKYTYADVAYTYAKSGTYNVKVTAHFTVNGKATSHTAADCQKPVMIPKKETPPPTPTSKNPSISIDKQVRTTGKDTVTKDEVLEQARNFRPKGHCTTVMTPAVHIETGVRYTFPSGCLPQGWVRADRYEGESGASTHSTAASSNWSEHVTVTPHISFQYRLLIKNTGDVDLTQAVVRDTAPAGVTLKSADKGTVAADGKSWSYTVPSLKVGASTNVVLTAVVEEYVEGKLINTACVDVPVIPGDKDDCDDATVDVHKPKEDTPVENEVPVCDPKTGKIITVKESEASKYLDKESTECKDKPPVKGVVTELPKTGLAEQLSGILGLGALTTATYYYVTSRRNG